MAYLVQPFPGWPGVEQNSTGIVIARSTATTPEFQYISTAKGKALLDLHGLIDSSIQVVQVLRGNTNSTPEHVLSESRLRQGELYLLFSIDQPDHYQAIESYRVVPLGRYFPTNELANKTLDDQIQIMFKWSVDHLNKEIAEDQERKQRLEEGLKR